jgi:SAM-dependent methyltransferase
MSKWTKPEIEEFLRRERFTYQRIELPFGLVTDGVDRSATARAIFPESLAGKSVLDLGCNNGYFCYEAARRGAARVVGLDVEHDMIRKNRIMAEILGLDIEFRVVDLDRQRIEEKFDYILGLNVIHHLRYPLYTLDNLAEAVNEKLVLEMASFGLADSVRMGIFPGLSPLLSRLPLIFISPGHARKKLKRAVISQSAIRNLLTTHCRIFSTCTIGPSEFKDRYFVKAEKHDIGHLVVVAGPTGAPADKFASQLSSGQLPDVAKSLGVEIANAVVIPSPSTRAPQFAFMAYDILNPFMRTGNVYSRDVELDLLSAARKVSFVTLKPDRTTIHGDFAKKMGSGKLFGKPSKRQRKILETYAGQDSYEAHFAPWLAFAREIGRSIVVETQATGAVARITTA